MDNTIYNIVAPDVITAARSVAREWPGLTTEEDLEQEIWVAILKGSLEAQDLVAGMSQAQRVSTLSEYGHRSAAKERDDYDLFSGNFYYSTQHVRDLLDADGLLVQDTRPDSLTNTERMDLDIAMDRLRTRNARYAFLIEQHYVFGVKFDNNDPDRKALDRAVDSLTIEMNRSNRRRNVEFRDGPGSRPSMSNAQAAEQVSY